MTSSEENKTVFTEEEQRYLKEYMKDIGGMREACLLYTSLHKVIMELQEKKLNFQSQLL